VLRSRAAADAADAAAGAAAAVATAGATLRCAAAAAADDTDKAMTSTELKPQQSNDPADKRFRISARLRHALDLMIWGNADGNPLDWDEAGRTVNISARSMRRSLERPAVRTYLREQKQVLRACISAKSLWRLDELAAQRVNMNAAVSALKVIEDGDASPTASNNTAAGVTIRIINQTVAVPLVDVTPARSIPVPQCVLDAQRPPGIDHEPLPAKADPTIFRPRRDW
jgi:hypothetical protein